MVVVVLSSLSALFSIGGVALKAFFLPLTILSFPLYTYTYSIFIEGQEWVPFFGIRLLLVGSTHPIGLGHAFPFFLFGNIVGAVLGYAISRILNQEWGTIKTWGLLGFILTIAFAGVGGLFRSVFIDKTGEIIIVTREGRYGANYFDSAILSSFGIIVLAIVVGKILWSKIQDEY
jgi:hypothetical protein